tara:strand:- start:448 stop:633 length:186 start_codon:yes stop_codon:yes gene_type:complete
VVQSQRQEAGELEPILEQSKGGVEVTPEEIKKIRDELAEVAKKLNEIADRLHYLATREVPQ